MDLTFIKMLKQILCTIYILYATYLTHTHIYMSLYYISSLRKAIYKDILIDIYFSPYYYIQLLY